MGRRSLVFLLATFLGLALAHGGPEVDGVIKAGEYQHSLKSDIGMEIYWTVSDGYLYLGLKAPGKGWVGFGLESIEGPGEGDEGHAHPAMLESDLLMAYVKDGKAYAEDLYVPAPGQPKLDTELGGTNDILKVAGTEDANGTTVELMRKLNTGDRYDVALDGVLGKEIGIMIAYHPTADDFQTYHGSKTREDLEIELGQ